MTLKENIINNSKHIRCSFCKHYETLKVKTLIPFCNKKDKIILPSQVNITRICEEYEV